MTFFCVMHRCRDLWHQNEGDQQVPFIRVVAHELRCVGVPIYRSVSIFFCAKLNFTVSFCIGIFSLIYIKETKEFKKNTEIYSVLSFTVLCDVIVLVLWFLQREREAVSPGFWRMPIFSGVGTGFKLLGIALVVWWHCDARQRKEWCTERELPCVKSLDQREF